MYNVHVADTSALISARIVSLELIMIRDKSGQTNLPPQSKFTVDLLMIKIFMMFKWTL